MFQHALVSPWLEPGPGEVSLLAGAGDGALVETGLGGSEIGRG